MSLLPLSAAVLKPVGAALIGTGLVTSTVFGVHAATSGSADPAAASSTSHHRMLCHAPGVRPGKKAPTALRSDLAAMRAKLRDSSATGAAKAAQRREALATIRKGIADGKYGKEAQQRAQKREARVEKRRAALPAKLRSDLAALAEMEPGKARHEAASKIRQGRLEGTYGAAVEAKAKQAQQRREQRKQTCQAQRQEQGQTKDQPKSSASPSAKQS